MPILKENKPAAGVLMFSMRAMGYTFEAAVADIVDNCISAEATVIDIKFPVEPTNLFLTICDNGKGMSYSELFDAMKYGSMLKSENRDVKDLGRFGLGLKSASLSQCRKLTVISKKDGEVSALSWDLDIIQKCNEGGWTIIEYDQNEIRDLSFSDYLKDLDHGTVVHWENFDLISKDPNGVYNELTKLQEPLSEYLSLIFHRFLSKSEGERIIININAFSLQAFDPFLEHHKKTNARRPVRISITDSFGNPHFVDVQPYILPFYKDLSQDDIKIMGGDENYKNKQGYYIYRNERLIIWGTWFGRRKDELTKHARVKVDIPNTLDDIWSVDIKKQTARIPRNIQHQLTKSVDEAMDIAVKVQKHRGRVENADAKREYIWDRIKERNLEYSYRINRDSIIFDIIKNDIDVQTWEKIDMVLEEIENNIPYQQIYIDKSQNRVLDDVDEDRLAKIELKAEILINTAESLGQRNIAAFIEELFESEPFVDFKELKLKLLAKEIHYGSE